MTSTTAPFLENILLFPRILRRAGLPISPEQSLDFAQALTLVEVGDREQVYHAARSLLVTRREHLDLFTLLFNRFWRTLNSHTPSRQTMPRAPRHRRREQTIPLLTLLAQKAGRNLPEIDVADKTGTYSPAEQLQHKDFSQMSAEELANVKRLIQEMRWPAMQRRTRRRVPGRQGQILDVRRVLRSATKYGGVPLNLSWQQRKVKQRPLVLLADISGSMDKYARLVLQFFYSASHSFKEVECFVFGTRLTRITAQLRLKNIDLAIQEAAGEVQDWAGGTRIGDSLHTFNQRWARRVLHRGAVVIVVSDGWDRGEPGRLRREMRYLQHRCHRLIWLNPLMGKPTYQPLVEGMAAARPYIDDFLPIHNLQSLTALAERLGQL